MIKAGIAAGLLLIAGFGGAAAQGQIQERPAPALAGAGFLVGDWTAGGGAVAETGGRATGRSRVTLEAGGAVLLRRDHTDLFDAAGKPAGGFDQIMMIYPEAGTLHADYSDGTHLIHYVSAQVEPGRAVTFTSAAAPGAPAFRLAYRLEAADELSVWFGMAPPGSADFKVIAQGELRRAH
jgi:hypothetical protein